MHNEIIKWSRQTKIVLNLSLRDLWKSNQMNIKPVYSLSSGVNEKNQNGCSKEHSSTFIMKAIAIYAERSQIRMNLTCHLKNILPKRNYISFRLDFDTMVSQALNTGKENRPPNYYCNHQAWLCFVFNFSGLCGTTADAIRVSSPFSSSANAFPPTVCGTLTGQHSKWGFIS